MRCQLNSTSNRKKVIFCIYGTTPRAAAVYELPYSDAFDHVHFTAAALDTVFTATGAPYEIFSEPQVRLIRDAVFTATQYLFQIAQRVDTYRDSGLAVRISTIPNRLRGATRYA